MRVFFVLFSAAILLGQAPLLPTLDDAARALAKTISVQLAAGETAHLSERSPDPASAAETARARVVLERALRRPAARGAAVVEVVVSAAASIRGPILIAEIQRGADSVVETMEYRAPPASTAARVSISSRKLWEQDEPILDLAPAADGFAVLSPSGLKLCHGNPAVCEAGQAHAAAAQRDPRGKLAGSGGDFTGIFAESPALDFQLDGEMVHFTPGQNTLETADGQKFYSLARVGSYRLTADVDGRVRVAQGQQKFAIDGWGSDVVAMPGVCGAGALVIATSPSEGDAADSVAAYELSPQGARAASDAFKFGGPVTALWPASGGALAVARQGARYAAYSLSLDCSR